MKALERARALWRLASGQRLAELLLEDAGAGGRSRAVAPSSTGRAGWRKGGASVPVSALAPGVSAEPLGWLGALVAHGGACQTFELGWMLTTRYHDSTPSSHGSSGHNVNPNISIQWDNWDDDVILEWGRDFLLTNVFRNWPAPIYPMFSPLLLAPDGTEQLALDCDNGTNWKSAFVEGNGANAAQAQLGTWGFRKCREWAYLSLDKEQGQESLDPYRAKVDSEGYLLMRRDGWSSYHRVKPGDLMHGYTHKLSQESDEHGGYRYGYGRRFNKYSEYRDALGLDEQLEVKVPTFWRSSEKRLAEYFDRLSRWYYTARWLVWACEMMRLNCRHTSNPLNPWQEWRPPAELVPFDPPSWWKRHCITWGIGVLDSDAWNSGVSIAGDAYPKPGHTYSQADPALELDLTVTEWEQIAKALMTHTPPPGSPGWTGEQITATGQPRTLCDMPPEAGSIRPPLELLDSAGRDIWIESAYQHLIASEESMPWFKWYKLAVEVVAACVSGGGGMGGAVSSGASAVTAAATTAGQVLASRAMYLVATFAVQATQKLGRGDTDLVSVGDVVGLIGNMINSSGLLEQLDTKVGIPADLWPALKTAGAAIPELVGTDWENVLPMLNEIQGRLDDLSANWHWNYLDAAYAGFGLTGRIREAAKGYEP